MLRCALCCFALIAFAPADASGQRAPTRQPANRPAQPANRPPPGSTPARATPTKPPAAANRAGDSGPVRPVGFKPVSLKTAQMENERLRAAIEKLEQRLKEKQEEAGKESAAAADAGAEKASASIEKDDKPASASDDEKRDPGVARAKRPTLEDLKVDNTILRRQVDRLLLKVAELEGTIPERPAGLPKYDPHIIDSPTNAEFCPGKTMEQLEDTMRFSGVPVGESEDEVAYEWTIYMTNAKRSKHVGHRVWAIMKDGVSSKTMEAAPGVVKDGPPPRAR
jgi:hypothetical protein